jgi:4-aminobutyrate aminotransferase-like enzyme/Ser/Thr protein kinase RdoA (MazF antagonist)
VLIKDTSGGTDATFAARLARERFALDGVASPLPGELDDNFRLDARDGPSYVLKVMHPGRERGFVSLVAEALRHLARESPSLALPRVVPAADGAPFVEAPDATGATRLVLLLTWVEGLPLAEARPRTRALHESLGRVLGEMDRGLASFAHPAAVRDLKWDLARAPWIRDQLAAIADPARRALVARCLDLYDAAVTPALPRLRRSVIHGDGNDWNALVAGPRAEPHAVVSVIDFGDMHEGLVVAEPAVAAAYTLLGQPDPLAAAAAVVHGYHGAHPLHEDEIAVLFPLVLARLAVSVTNSAIVARHSPADPYVTISEAPAWDALERLSRVPTALAHATFRAACGLPAVPGSAQTMAWLRGLADGAPASRPARVLDRDLARGCLVVDLGVSSLLLGADPDAAAPGALARTIHAALEAAGRTVAVGRYREARTFYQAPAFGAAPGEEGRTVHLGLDFFVEPGTPVRAPLDGVVHLVADNAAPLDYGPLVVLRHEPDAGVRFFTLYGHLGDDTLTTLRPGEAIARGQAFARVGAPPSNGGWAPHLHLQVMLDLLGLDAAFPGVARASDLDLWTSVSPDPNLLLQVPPECFPQDAPTRDETRDRRRRHLGRNLSLAYRQPLKIVRGWMQHLYDDTGRAYLDTFNNVPLVGHSHPRVVRAAREQLALLNTNTRYLHDNAVRYAERLTALMPEPLRVCYFVNSGSEANELALRLAGTHAGKGDVIVLEHAYHGNTRMLVDVSPYKFDGPGGTGRKPFVHVVPIPDDYRGAYRRDDPERGAKYARSVGDVVAGLVAGGAGPATFIAETLPSVGGQVVLPPGYLREAYRHVRAAGGVVVADEVQVGFGRLGTHFWGFDTQDVVPDIVVLGKPIGNAFPLAAVVTTPEIAASFDNGMEYFSTFGGNPVACAVGLAVLDVVRDERLQERAWRVGGYLRAGLERLGERHAIVGDVRGSGLFLGVEFVRDRATLEPATEESSYVVNRMRERGVLCGLDGPHDNVLKIRPPLVFGEADADQFVATLDDVLAEDPIAPLRA